MIDDAIPAPPAPPTEELATTGEIPGDVCQYLNSIENIDIATLPTDIMMLQIDTMKGKFRGYSAYPSLQEEMNKMVK